MSIMQRCCRTRYRAVFTDPARDWGGYPKSNGRNASSWPRARRPCDTEGVGPCRRPRERRASGKGEKRENCRTGCWGEMMIFMGGDAPWLNTFQETPLWLSGLWYAVAAVATTQASMVHGCQLECSTYVECSRYFALCTRWTRVDHVTRM